MGIKEGKAMTSNDIFIPQDAGLDEVRKAFSADRFATEACGARITHAEYGHAVCEMEIGPHLFNAGGNVQGGAIFTLADFALAVACNIGEKATVSASSAIQFMNASRGSRLIAECRVDKSGRTLGFYTVDVTDDLGVPIAKMVATGFR